MKKRNSDSSIKYLILEALGWIGLAVMILTVVLIVSTIVIALLQDLEFGISFLLIGIVVISLGVTTSYWIYRVWLFEKEQLLSQRFVYCPYCGMKNYMNAAFCIRCGKAIPELPFLQPKFREERD